MVIITIILVFLSVSLIYLIKAYGLLPTRELKARARSGDKQAAKLWRARAYAESLYVILWALAGISTAAFFWQLAQYSGWLAVPTGALFIWLAFAWQPVRSMSSPAVSVAAFIAPALAWVLEYLHVLIDPAVRLAVRHASPPHTGLYDTEDLLDVIEDQYHQPDNRIDRNSLNIAINALTFGHRQIREVMTPSRQVTQVSIDDTIGPILMNELHASGQSHFPVYEGKKDHIVGSLSLRDLVDAKATGPVRDRMHREVHVLSEGQALSDTLEQILQPGRHLFTVLNDREEYVGTITTEDILRQIIGHPEPDELEEYQSAETETESEIQQKYSESIDNVHD